MGNLGAKNFNPASVISKPGEPGELTNGLVNHLNVDPLGSALLDKNGFIRNINQAASRMLGVPVDSALNNLFVNHINPEDREIFRNKWLSLTETNGPQSCEIRLTKPGPQIWIRLNFSISEPGIDPVISLFLNDISIQKLVENTHSFLLGKIWSNTGKDFFEDLAVYLAKTAGVDYVCIDKLINKGNEAQTVAVYLDGKIENNTRYRLKDTPCGTLVDQDQCNIQSGVRHLFPKDEALQEISAESYSGISLRGSDGKPIGLIALISREPMPETNITEMLLKQVSIRAASELEHRELEAAIINSHNQLEKIVKARTAELQKTNRALKKEISKGRQKEKSLKKTEEKYRTVADFTYDWETWVGPDGKFIYVSPSCEPTTGYSVEEFMDDPSLVIKITHPDDRDLVRNHYLEKRKRKLPSCSLDFRIVTREGEEKWIAHSCQPVFDSSGKWIGQRGSNRDITERKKAESVLMASQEQLRALTRRMNALAEEERGRISREIHDEFGHLLTALKLEIEHIITSQDLSMDTVRVELESMINIIDALIDSVREIASELRPGVLDHLGLLPAIEWQLKQFHKRTRISCSFDPGKITTTFNRIETTTIFRILQEILTNVARHSGADKLEVTITRQKDLLILTATDNGKGFEPADIKSEGGLGLMGMHERALSIGAKLKIESSKGKGTKISLSFKK